MSPARPTRFTVRVPATTANLGPGFDCLGLTLNLWNEATFTVTGEAIEVSATGEGSDRLPHGDDNLVVSALRRLYEQVGEPSPRGLRIDCRVGVPLASGLGSSSSAVVAGLLAANELLGGDVSGVALLGLAAELEGHPDNVAAALGGGLVVVVRSAGDLLTERFDLPAIDVGLAVPRLEYSTTASRAELPTYVALEDAVYNMGRTTLVVEALRRADLELLGKAMDDRLHQAQRLEHVPGGVAAMAAALAAGAAAVAVSGSGPSLIAFCENAPSAAVAAGAMVDELSRAGVHSRPLTLRTTTAAATVERVPGG
jgi:homoserine kinase